MERRNTCVLLNAGSRTRTDFASGLDDVTFKHYKTKEMLMHVRSPRDILVIHENATLDFGDAYVFTRLRATDQHFCGLLHEYFTYHNVPASDPMNLTYPQAEEKIAQMVQFSLAGIPVPPSFIFREESFKKNVEYLRSHIIFPAIYKTDGSKGKNVHLVNSFEEIEKLLSVKKRYVLAMVQPFIENTFDTRTLVAYDRVLGSIKRIRQNGYRNNVALGAKVEIYTLTKEENELAHLATKTAKLDFGGVDMFHTDKGPVVIEVNKSPQVGGFELVHTFKVFSKIAKIIKEELL